MVGGLALAAIACTGCANLPSAGMSKDDYRATFAAVIRKSFDETKTNNLCLPPLFGFGGPAPESVEVNIDNEARLPQPGTGRYAQFKALESVGLVAGVESERMMNNKPQRFATFRRTEAGSAYFSGNTFCYARVELGEVVKWKGPAVIGEYRAAWVYYTTKTSRVADWANAPAIQAAFPMVGGNLKGTEPAKLRQVAIDLSSEGWDIAEYSKLLQLQ
jgi:hypothetical protein